MPFKELQTWCRIEDHGLIIEIIAICSVAFSRAEHLKEYMRTHTGAKPYKCTICSVACFQSGHLKEHKLTHAGDKPYKCTISSAAFSRSGTLKIQMGTHTVVLSFLNKGTCKITLQSGFPEHNTVSSIRILPFKDLQNWCRIEEHVLIIGINTH